VIYCEKVSRKRPNSKTKR